MQRLDAFLKHFKHELRRGSDEIRRIYIIAENIFQANNSSRRIIRLSINTADVSYKYSIRNMIMTTYSMLNGLCKYCTKITLPGLCR